MVKKSHKSLATLRNATICIFFGAIFIVGSLFQYIETFEREPHIREVSGQVISAVHGSKSDYIEFRFKVEEIEIISARRVNKPLKPGDHVSVAYDWRSPKESARIEFANEIWVEFYFLIIAGVLFIVIGLILFSFVFVRSISRNKALHK